MYSTYYFVSWYSSIFEILGGNKIGSDGGKTIARSLIENSLLDTLYLGITKQLIHIENNEIGDDGAEEFSIALKENRRLSILDLSINKSIAR